MNGMLWILAARGEDGSWVPGNGDPTFTGWLTTLAYFAAMTASIWAAHVDHGAQFRWRNFRIPFWYVMAAGLGLLGINKQLDLQSWFTHVGRDIAKSAGWYEDRRVLQGLFVGTVALVGAGLMLMAGMGIRHAWRKYLLAILGMAYLVVFIIIRAASFHHVDVILGKLPVLGRAVNVGLELGGIAMIGVAAWRAVQRESRPKMQVFERVVRVR